MGEQADQHELAAVASGQDAAIKDLQQQIDALKQLLESLEKPELERGSPQLN